MRDRVGLLRGGPLLLPLADARALTVEVMADAFEMRVPLAVNVSTGHSWADAK